MPTIWCFYFVIFLNIYIKEGTQNSKIKTKQKCTCTSQISNIAICYYIMQYALATLQLESICGDTVMQYALATWHLGP